MNEKSGAKPSGKILFGVDYLYVMRFMKMEDIKAKQNKRDFFIDGITNSFLHQWGFSANEIDEANSLFYAKGINNELEDSLDPVIERIVEFIKNDKEKKERFVIQIATLGLLDFNVTEREAYFTNLLKDKFDLQPSEFHELIKKAFNSIGQEYLEDNSNN